MDNGEGLESNFNGNAKQDEESGDAQRGGREGMDELASMLKRAREEKGISLRDAEMETRVPTRYLEILEGEGDPRLLAEELYLVPFLRTYSVFLGLDPTVTIPQFIAAVQKGEGLSGLPRLHPHRSVFRTVLTILLLVGLAVLLFWWIGVSTGNLPWQ
jgi:cytoskeletal protein RodZ